MMIPINIDAEESLATAKALGSIRYITIMMDDRMAGD